MKTPKVTVKFDKKTGLYSAEESTSAGLFAGFGSTPEEAMERLEISRMLCADCEECRKAQAASDEPAIDPYVH